MKRSQVSLTLAVAAFIVLASGTPTSAKPLSETIVKHFLFCSNEFETNDEDKPLCKAWTEEEQLRMLDLLEKVEEICPQLIEKAVAPSKLTLERISFSQSCDSEDPDEKYLAYASAHPGYMEFSDVYFSAARDRQLEILLHELTHEADFLEKVGYSPEWRFYFSRHYGAHSKNTEAYKEDWNVRPCETDPPEALAQTLPKYLLGLPIPDKSYFEDKILPLLFADAKDQIGAMRHYVKGREFYNLNYNLPAAKRELCESIRISPMTMRQRIMYIELLYDKGDYQECQQELDKAIKLADDLKLHPKEAYRLTLYVYHSYLKMNFWGDYQSALEDLQAVIKAAPKNNWDLDHLIECKDRMIMADILKRPLLRAKTKQTCDYL